MMSHTNPIVPQPGLFYPVVQQDGRATCFALRVEQQPGVSVSIFVQLMARQAPNGEIEISLYPTIPGAAGLADSGLPHRIADAAYQAASMAPTTPQELQRRPTTEPCGMLNSPRGAHGTPPSGQDGC